MPMEPTAEPGQFAPIPPMEPGQFHNLMTRRTLTISVSVDTLVTWGVYALGLALVFCGYVLIGYAEERPRRGQE